MVGPLLLDHFLLSTTLVRGQRFILNQASLGYTCAAFLASALFVCHLLPPGSLRQTSPGNWVYYWALPLGSPSRGLSPNWVREGHVLQEPGA